MNIDEAREELSRMKGHHYFAHGDEALDMAIHALEIYDFEENNISEYEYEASIDNFLIDEEEEDHDNTREGNRTA